MEWEVGLKGDKTVQTLRPEQKGHAATGSDCECESDRARWRRMLREAGVEVVVDKPGCAPS